MFGVCKIDLDVVVRPCLPRTVLGERMARTGDDPPAGGRKALDRRMPDAARGTGENERLALAVGGLCHALRDIALTCSSCHPDFRAGMPRGHAGGTAGHARIRSIGALRGSPTSKAD